MHWWLFVGFGQALLWHEWLLLLSCLPKKADKAKRVLFGGMLWGEGFHLDCNSELYLITCVRVHAVQICLVIDVAFHSDVTLHVRTHTHTHTHTYTHTHTHSWQVDGDAW